jgi:atypical dual specificity phosphatase
MPPALCLKDFGVAFGGRTILRSVSFDVPPRGCTVLMGPAGTGKSTLVRTLAGLNDAHPGLRTWGHASFSGRPGPGSASPPVLVQQNLAFHSGTVLECLVSEWPDRSSLSRSEQAERITHALWQCGQAQLLRQLHDPIASCRLADQRLVGLLAKLLPDPPLLMADEPTAGLSPREAKPVLELLKRQARERALLVVTHHQRQARRLARQVVLLADGVVQASTTPAEFFEAPASLAARCFVRTGSCPEDSRAPDPGASPGSAAGYGATVPDDTRAPPRFTEAFARVVANLSGSSPLALTTAQAKVDPA